MAGISNQGFKKKAKPSEPRPCGKCGATHTRIHHWCNDCQVAYNREWRESRRNDPVRLAKHRENKAKLYQQNKIRIMAQHRLRPYGLTGCEHTRMRIECQDLCQLCGSDGMNNGKPGLMIDHDHETGLIRGLLCQKCNMGLGLLGETSEALTKAAEYLKKRA